MTKRQALVIGINQYPFGHHLSTAAQDAEKIAQLLEEYGSFEVHRLPIYDEREVSQDLFVTLPELKTAITRLFQPESGIIPETALLFFAGHGWRRQKNGQTEGFLVTSYHDDNCRESGLFSLKDLHQILKNSWVPQQIVWLDCCHSGELFNFTETNLGKETRGRDRCLIVASREFETAIGGVLTPALLAGLNPENNSDGWVTNYTLTDFIDKKLNAEKPQQNHRCSNPTGIIHLTGKNGVLANIRPYRGLKYFDFNPEQPKACDDHKYFYGRKNLTKQLLQKLRESNFIAVLGPSGSGKSSLVRAGLLYQLYLGYEIAGSHSWKLYPSFRPGKHPLESLQNVIGVESDPLEALVKRASAEQRVVLVIDQFEEIFTECKDDAERQKFFNGLLRSVEGLGNKLCLVLVMRSDFEGIFDQPEYEKIGRKISQKQNLFRVEQMTDVELREAIIEPAKKVEIEVETELVTSLIKQVENSPAYLPLLQFTLDKLWQQSQKKRLINSDLTKLGGVGGALEQHANEIYDSFLQDDKNLLPNQQGLGLATQQVAKWIFVALTRLNVEGGDTPRQVRKEDLLTDQSPEAEELLEQVIKRLVDAKLIVTSNLETENKKIPVVDIAHEALIRYLPGLYSWLQKNREALLIRQDIEDAAQTWRDQDKNNRHQLSHSKQNKFITPFIHYFSLLAGENRSYLRSGKQLKEAENFIKKEDIQLSQVANDFVNLSLQRRKYSRIVGILLISILGVLGTTLYFQSRVSLSKSLVEQAKDLRKQPAEFQTSMLLAMEAVRIHESLETTQNLWNGLTYLPQNITKISLKNDNDSELSKTKKYQVTKFRDDRIMLKSWNNGQKKYEEIYPHTPFGSSSTYVIDYKFSPNDHYLAIGYGKNGGDSEVLSDMTNHTKAQTENVKLGGEDNFKKIAFSYNNKYISTANHDNKIELWDANSRKRIWEIKSTTQLNKIAFSPGDKYLAVTDSSQIRLLEPLTKKIKTINWQNGNMGKIVFCPEGKYLFGTSQLDKSAYSESSVFVSQVWDIETESEVARFIDKDEIQKVTYSSDGKFLNIEYRNGIVKQWEPAKRWILSLRTQDDILSLNFSDNGKYLVAIGQTNAGVSADIWDVNSHKKIKTFGLASNSSPATTVVYAVLFSNDFKYLFISLNVGGISGYRTQLHETQTGNEISSFWDDNLSFEESCKSRSTWKAEKYSARCIDDRKIIVKENSSNREIILSKPATFSTQDFMKQIKQHDRKAMFIRDYILSEERFKEIVSEKKHDDINSITFSKDRKLLAVADATGTENNIITLVSLPQNKVTDEVCQRLTRNFTKEEWKHYLPGEGYRKTCSNLP